MRVVVFVGSEPASADPRRIDRNGIAMRTISSVAAPANTAGRSCIQSVQRAHAVDSSESRQLLSASALRSRRRSTSRPKIPSIAGSSVSAASTVNATATAAATATPYRKLTPRANIPSIAMHTIIPANRTARPEVSSDSTAASSRCIPRSRPWRYRVTMNSA